MSLFTLVVVGSIAWFTYAFLSLNPVQDHYKKGCEFLAQHNFHDAEQHFLKAVDASDQTHTPSLLKLADLYESQTMTDKCLKYLKLARISFPSQFDKYALTTNFRVAEIFYSTGRFQEAWQILLLLFRMGHSSASMFYLLGEMYMVHRRYGEATNFFDESLQIDDNQPRAKFFRGLCLIAMKENREALKFLTELSNDREYGSQALFLMGKLCYDMERWEEASMHFGNLLNARDPIFLKDILLYKGYEVLMKDKHTTDDLTRAAQFFIQGTHIKDLPTEVRKEFLFHLGGVYILNRQFNEAKVVLRDLCRVDAYYKGADHLLKMVSKEMLIKEEHGLIMEKYTKIMREAHCKHEIARPLRLELFMPKNLPLYSMEQMEENAQKSFVKILEEHESISGKYDSSSPRTPMELSMATYENFVNSCKKMSSKMGLMVDRNISDNKYEAIFVGIDKSEMKNLVYFFKPTSVVGAISVVDVADRRDRLDCKKAVFLNCGNFTEEASEIAKKQQISLMDKKDLRKLL